MTSKPLILMRMLKVPFRVFLVAFLCCCAVAYAAPLKKLYVQVKQSKLRAEPKFWAPSIADLQYGTELESIQVVPADKSWLRVKMGNTEGFAHITAVTSRKIVLSGNLKEVNPKVDSLSMSLAGKGFNKKVEGSYAQSRGIDYSAVDEVEKYSVDSNNLYAFLTEGRLNEK